MLRGLTALQFSEWMAFFRIRETLRKEIAGAGDPRKTAASASRQGYGDSPEEQNRMSGDLLRNFQGYQRRQELRQGKTPGKEKTWM